MSKKLQDAQRAIDAGNRRLAYRLLYEVIKVDPQGKEAEIACLKLSTIVETPAQKRKCFEIILRLNPNSHQARQELASLYPSDSPPLIEEPPVINDSGLPPILEDSGAVNENTNSKFTRYGIENRSSSDIKDVGKTTLGVAFGILSAPIILVIIVIVLCLGLCFGCYFFSALGSSLSPDSQEANPTKRYIPPTYTPVRQQESGQSTSRSDYLDTLDDVRWDLGLAIGLYGLAIEESASISNIRYHEDFKFADELVDDAERLIFTATPPQQYSFVHSQMEDVVILISIGRDKLDDGSRKNNWSDILDGMAYFEEAAELFTVIDATTGLTN